MYPEKSSFLGNQSYKLAMSQKFNNLFFFKVSAGGPDSELRKENAVGFQFPCSVQGNE